MNKMKEKCATTLCNRLQNLRKTVIYVECEWLWNIHSGDIHTLSQNYTKKKKEKNVPHSLESSQPPAERWWKQSYVEGRDIDSTKFNTIGFAILLCVSAWCANKSSALNKWNHVFFLSLFSSGAAAGVSSLVLSFKCLKAKVVFRRWFFFSFFLVFLLTIQFKLLFVSSLLLLLTHTRSIFCCSLS